MRPNSHADRSIFLFHDESEIQMACECRTGNRTLVLFSEHALESLNELFDFSLGSAWQADRQRGVISVLIGPDGPWPDVMQVINFLRTVLDDNSLETIQSGWRSGCCSDPQDVAQLDDIKPLMARATTEKVPLLEILQARRIETWFQPILSMPSMDLWGHECLMRGRDAEGTLHQPGTLLQWASQERLVFMLDRICREIHIANAAAADLPAHSKILINFLPTAIYDPAFCLRTTEAAVKKAGLDRSRIIFEAVESEQVTDSARLVKILEYYRASGYGVALDDVGAGYAGLTMLAELNPDLIKIDREIVRNAPTSRMHHSVCKALVSLAKDLDKLVLAEGIESQQEVDCMAAMGVDLVQGFLFGKPAITPQTYFGLRHAA